MSNVVQLYDSFRNLISGLGTLKDKSIYQQPTLTLLNQADLENLYRGDWLSRKIVEIPAFDATRAWRQWQADDEQIEDIEDQERFLKLQQKVMQALIKARLYGGSAMILGVAGTGNFNEELDLDRVKKDSLKFVHVVERWSLGTGPRILDITSPWYGEPNYYVRNNVPELAPIGGVDPSPKFENLAPASSQLYIHPSRIVRVIGADYPDVERAPDSWGDSVLQGVSDAINAFGNVIQSVSNMVTEAKVDVISVAGLTNHIETTAGLNKLVSRFTNANVAKSIINSLLLDKDNETWERKQLQFGGLEGLMGAFEIVACGAADIPATRLFGRSPQGMNATGDSDTRNYYDKVSAEQRMKLTPMLTQLDEVLIRHALGKRDPAIWYDWVPLYQMDDKEKAAIEMQKAQAHKIDVDSGLINPDALRIARENSLNESGFLYPGLKQAMEEADETGELPWVEEDPMMMGQLPPGTSMPPGTPTLPGEPMPEEKPAFPGQPPKRLPKPRR